MAMIPMLNFAFAFGFELACWCEFLVYTFNISTVLMIVFRYAELVQHDLSAR
jgi:hypothetical protein